MVCESWAWRHAIHWSRWKWMERPTTTRNRRAVGIYSTILNGWQWRRAKHMHWPFNLHQRPLSEHERAAFPKHERLVAVLAISSLLVVARIVCCTEGGFFDPMKIRIRGKSSKVPLFVRGFCLVADMNFAVRTKEVARAFEEGLHYLLVLPGGRSYWLVRLKWRSDCE